MALTAEMKKELDEIIERTAVHRTTVFNKVIPEDYQAFMSLTDRIEKIVTFEDDIPPVRVVITTAKDRTPKCPVHVNFHGGGFVYKQDGDDDLYCAHIAAEIKGIVVDVDYAVSTEAPFPAGFNQAYEIMKMVFAKCEEWDADPKRVSIGGSSAGGCLTAAVCLKVGDTGDFKVCLQVLDYAATENYRVTQSGDPRDERSMAFSLYYADGNADTLKEPYCSPYYAEIENMHDQPKTLIIGPEKCPFYPVNLEYGRKLMESGAEVTFRSYPNSRHGFAVRMMDDWRDAQEVIIRHIKEASL